MSYKKELMLQIVSTLGVNRRRAIIFKDYAISLHLNTLAAHDKNFYTNPFWKRAQDYFIMEILMLFYIRTTCVKIN